MQSFAEETVSNVTSLNTKAEMEIYFGDMVSTEMAQNKI
jgi:hypothetical protein